MDEERRLLYVAATRAKYYLQLSCCMQRHRKDHVFNHPPSRFLTPEIAATRTTCTQLCDSIITETLPLLCQLTGRPPPDPNFVAAADTVAAAAAASRAESSPARRLVSQAVQTSPLPPDHMDVDDQSTTIQFGPQPK